MSHTDYPEQIKESAEELYELKCKTTAAIVRDRLRFLRLLFSFIAVANL